MSDALGEMGERFGQETADAYRQLVKATRSLTYVWDLYIRAPSGSAQEAVLDAAMAQMMKGFRRQPEKAIEMIESLLTVIQHMRWGGTLEEWFKEMGVAPTPDKEEEEQ